jgi:hypothetical protein
MRSCDSGVLNISFRQIRKIKNMEVDSEFSFEMWSKSGNIFISVITVKVQGEKSYWNWADIEFNMYSKLIFA